MPRICMGFKVSVLFTTTLYFLFILCFPIPITFVPAADAAGERYMVFLVQSTLESQCVGAVQQSVCSHGEEIRGKSIFANCAH